MYEPVAHELLNRLLDDVARGLEPLDRTFLTRLGANFYSIHQLFLRLYGTHPNREPALRELVGRLVAQHAVRSEARRNLDRERELDHRWFLHQKWVGMALYTDGFAGDLAGTRERLGYLQELGVNVVHLMPLLRCPPGASDGGYAVSDYRAIDDRVGTLDDLDALADAMRDRDMLLVLDVVLNHTSDQHAWAELARAGDPRYRDYYLTFPDRTLPDRYEQSMPEVFPDNAPGNFTWDEAMQRWVMTVFHDYQWDLDYSNPFVFVELLDVLLFWANHGADVLRLDAVAFTWKKLGTTCQNLPEAHLLLQLFKDCTQVVAPGVLFIAEAIVAPVEVTKYFGEDAVVAKECEIAYNATLMALLWDAVATQNTRLLASGIDSLPDKLELATWLNYLRCHDDIGLGFDDADVRRAGYEPRAHRRFLVDWFTGEHAWSNARGQRFAENPRTGDVRFTGSLASLAGLEKAIASEDPVAIDRAIDRICMLHGVILAFGGIAWLYYGDELGVLNDWSYQDDPGRAHDSRYLNRPRIDDARRDQRLEKGSITHRIFTRIAGLIATRKEIPAFADRNHRHLLHIDDDRVFGWIRTHPDGTGDDVVVLANFSEDTVDLPPHRLRLPPSLHLRFDRVTNSPVPRTDDGGLRIGPLQILWLSR